jgi:mannose-6-phosphate isomerase-like protein (cupin superfamily)
MKLVLAALFLAAGLALAAQPGVTIFSANEIQSKGDKLLGKRLPFADETLPRFGNHYFLLAAREQTGSAELHEHEADVFVVERGGATLLSGGKIVKGHTEKPGEIRGSSIEGGQRHALNVGDIVHIPAGVPHEVLLDKREPFVYFVIKVTGQ